MDMSPVRLESKDRFKQRPFLICASGVCDVVSEPNHFLLELNQSAANL